MKNWKDLKKELLKDKKIQKEYEDLAPRYMLISQIIEARKKKGLTQEDLAEKIGTKQSAIARIESGKTNPTIDFLERVANALDYELNIQFK